VIASAAYQDLVKLPERVWPCQYFAIARSLRVVTVKSSSPSLTLGDLLYPDGSAAALPEHDWVRLIAAIGSGDQEALRSLYERTHRIVFTLAVRICSSRESAEEVTIDVFHEVWRRALEFDPKDGTVIGWLMIQARSRAIDRLRFEQRKKRVPPADPARIDGVETSDPTSTIVTQERRRLIAGALTALTSDERQAIETAYFSELTYVETAVQLDQPVGTVKSRVRSALAKLRKALASEGGSR